MSSWNTTGALATPNGMTSHLKTRPFVVMKARSCSSEVHLPKSTALVHLCLVTTGGYALKGVLHVG